MTDTLPTRDPTIRYRSDPRDEEYATAEEEHAALRAYVQHVSGEMTPEGSMDTLLYMAKIFELRAHIAGPDHTRSQWYMEMSRLIRKLISLSVHMSKDAPRPDIVFEDDSLYWPKMRSH